MLDWSMTLPFLSSIGIIMFSSLHISFFTVTRSHTICPGSVTIPMKSSAENWSLSKISSRRFRSAA